MGAIKLNKEGKHRRQSRKFPGGHLAFPFPHLLLMTASGENPGAFLFDCELHPLTDQGHLALGCTRWVARKEIPRDSRGLPPTMTWSMQLALTAERPPLSAASNDEQVESWWPPASYPESDASCELSSQLLLPSVLLGLFLLMVCWPCVSH